MSDEEATIERSAENIVDVEDELADRERQARERARRAESDERDADNDYWSPKVIGTGEVDRNKYGEDRLEIRLADELPSGRDTIRVSVPDEDKIADQTHQFNRLLSLYDLDPSEFSLITGERLPMRVRNNPDSETRPSYDVDYPPVNTLPNRALWRGRRAATRLGLLRWGKTPKSTSSIFRRRSDLIFDDGHRAKAMPKSVVGLIEPFEILSLDEERYVPTNAGMATLIAALVALAFSPPLLAFWLGLPSLVIGAATLAALLFGFMVVGPLALTALIEWGKLAVKGANERFFPDPDSE